MTTKGRKVEALTGEVRACFNRLKALGDLLHQDLRITAAMRAVLESIVAGGEQTVPQIARAKAVTRQHIQVIVNNLADLDLIAIDPNPADKRSPLVRLTDEGRAAFARMREREREVLSELGRALSRCDVDASIATLAALHRWLDRRLEDSQDGD